jgi:hypothetical protein
MRIYYLFLFLIFAPSSTNAQDSLVYKHLKIWSLLKEYHYQALYIDSDGTTITSEKIVVKPTGKQSPAQKIQTVLDYFYNYTAEDSARLSANPLNATAFTRKYNTIQWRRYVPEGAIETATKLWIHPFRINQYSLTEIAPFPTVIHPLIEGSSWKSIIFIAKGWGTFRGNSKEIYTIGKPSSREYPFAKLDNCWEINAKGEHSKLGSNSITYYYHSDYGFVEMNYSFYNGQKIRFVLEKVVQR